MCEYRKLNMAATENRPSLNQPCAQRILTSPIDSDAYNEQGCEDSETTVAVEGSKNKRPVDVPEVHNFLSAAASGPDVNEDPDGHESLVSEETMNVEDLACTIKQDECIIIHGLRDLIRNPNTWRIIKGALVIILLWKFYSAVDVIEEYIPECINLEALKTFLRWH